jgi:hypothetical protein
MVPATVESGINVATVGQKHNFFTKWLDLQRMRRKEIEPT